MIHNQTSTTEARGQLVDLCYLMWTPALVTIHAESLGVVWSRGSGDPNTVPVYHDVKGIMYFFTPLKECSRTNFCSENRINQDFGTPVICLTMTDGSFIFHWTLSF